MLSQTAEFGQKRTFPNESRASLSMEKVKAEALKSNFEFERGLEIHRVERFPDTLSIYVSGGLGETRCVVTFNAPLGFRVLDERDLLEYWPVCSTSAGWLFLILSNGWVAQEQKRPGNLIFETYPDVQEYFIPSMGDCVSVLSCEPPTITLWHQWMPRDVNAGNPG